MKTTLAAIDRAHRAANQTCTSEGPALRGYRTASPAGKRIIAEARSNFAALSFSQLITIVCAFAILLFASGCSPNLKKQRHLTRAQDFFKAEQYDKAEIELLNVLRIESTNAVAIRYLGLSYFWQGRLVNAFPLLQKATELEPQNDEVRLRLASVLAAARKLKEARDQVDNILTRNPANEDALMLLADTAGTPAEINEVRQRLESLRPRAQDKAGFHLALASLFLRQRQTNEALAGFERGLALDPQSSPAHIGLGNLAVLAKDSAKADFHFKKAAELAPVRSARRLQYAEFKLRNGETAAAKAFLQEMSKQAPDYLPTHIRLAEIAFVERQFDVATSLIRNILNRDPGNYEAMLLQGRVNLANGKFSEALADFERLVLAYPRIPQAHFHFAVAQRLNKNEGKAIASLQQALALDPKNSDSILLLAELNILKGDMDAAIPPLNQLVKDQPQLAQAHLLLATAYRSRRDLDAAAGVYKNMATLFPRNPQPHLLLGEVLVLQQKKEEARKQFERAIEIAPDFPPALEELVDLDIDDKRFATARERVQRYIDKSPNKPALHVLLAKIYSAEKNDTAAEAALSRAIALDADHQPAYLALARLYISANKHQAALDKLKAVQAKSPNDMGTLMLMGMIQTEMKDYKAAHDTYQRLLAVDPRFGPALNNLASICSEYLNLPDKAFEYARAARDVAPSDPVTADTLGWVLFKRGEYARALTLLQESAQNLPRPEPEVWFHLGMTHYMLGEEQAARTAFERAIQIGRPFRGKEDAQLRLDLISGSGGNLKDVAALEGYLKANPRDPILLARLADLYEQSGAFDKAARAYNDILQANAKNVSAMLKLARLYAGPLRDIEKAMQIARDARRVAPEDPQVGHALARLAFQVGNHQWSLSLLQESAQKLTDDPSLFYDLAWSSYSMGQVPNANDAMKKALGLGKQFSQAADAKRFLEFTTATQPADVAVATPQIAAALNGDPSYVPALFASGLLAERNGNTADARDAYSKVIKTFPSFLPAHKRLALLLFSSDAAAAYEHATKAREGFPTDPEVARTLGILSFQRKEYSRAAQLLSESSRNRPNDAEGLYYLGVAQSHLKQTRESRLALERAISLQTNAAFVADARRILAEIK